MSMLEEQLEKVVGRTGPLAEMLQTAEKKSGLGRKTLLGLLGAGLVIWLVVGYAAQLLSGIIGFLFPALQSIK